MSVTLRVVWCHFWFCGLEWSLRLWFLERPGLKFWFCYLSELQVPYLSEGNNTSFRIGVRIKWDNVQALPCSKCSKMWIKMLTEMQISEMPLASCVYDFLTALLVGYDRTKSTHVITSKWPLQSGISCVCVCVCVVEGDGVGKNNFRWCRLILNLFEFKTG